MVESPQDPFRTGFSYGATAATGTAALAGTSAILASRSPASEDSFDSLDDSQIQTAEESFERSIPSSGEQRTVNFGNSSDESFNPTGARPHGTEGGRDSTWW